MLMDRLDINYIRECNDINKLFNIITMEYTIDIMKAENKYYLESSLIKLQNDSILFENSNEVKPSIIVFCDKYIALLTKNPSAKIKICFILFLLNILNHLIVIIH